MDQFRNQEYINPGPIVNDVLTLRGKHRADAIWNGGAQHNVLVTRRAGVNDHYRNIDNRIIPYLRLAGFYGVSQIGVMNVNNNLVTALVERWRPETHTFHLSVGEATLSLQDIGVLTGLPIDGRPVTGHLYHDWAYECGRLLGQVPSANEFRGHSVKMSWLGRHFNILPANANEYQIQCFARAWILRCIGGLLCPTQSNNYIHLMWLPLLENLEVVGEYSWGSAVLAWLYRELCRATKPEANSLGGYLQLLQMWAWERLPHIRPEFVDQHVVDQSMPYGCMWRFGLDPSKINSKDVFQYRLDLDLQCDDQMVWEPYRNVLHLLPQFCINGNAIWTSVVPLVCWNIIEWHHPDRCLRQFGMDQPIPHPPQYDDAVHSYDLRGHTNQNWESRFSCFIHEWSNRHNRVVRNSPLQAPLHPRSQYMQWYSSRTIRWMTQIGASIGASADYAEQIRHSEIGSSSNAEHGIRLASDGILGAVGAFDRRTTDYPRQPVPDTAHIPPMAHPFQDSRQSIRSRRGMGERRTTVESIHIPAGVHQGPQPMQWPYFPEDPSSSCSLSSVSQEQLFDTVLGQARCNDFEAGPSALNVDLNISLSSGDQHEYDVIAQTGPSCQFESTQYDQTGLPFQFESTPYAPTSQSMDGDDFFNELFSGPDMAGSHGFVDQPQYSGEFCDVMPLPHDPTIDETDSQTDTHSRSNRSRRF